MKIRGIGRSVVVVVALIGPAAVSAQEALNVTPTSISVQADEGTTPPSRTVLVTNDGNQAMKWTIAPPTANWLSVSPTSGVQRGTVTVSFASTLPAGTHSASFTVTTANSSVVTVNVQVTIAGGTSEPPPPPPPPPPSPSGVGPQSTITCPAGAVYIVPGASIQNVVNSQVGNTTFCLRAGIHPITSAITPKTGNVFVGEYGAILDGSGWSASDVNLGAFCAHNEDIDDVTIRNLVIRNMPQKGIHAFRDYSDRWTVEYNEITGTLYAVAAPNTSVVRNNYIHHNREGAYAAYRSVGTTFEGNEIAYQNGRSKIVASANVTFRNNFVHHNAIDGIWYDADNTNALIEGNRVEDNGREGIFFELSQFATIRNNTVRRNGSNGIFISTSKNVETYGNTLEDNLVGIQYFVNCDLVGQGTIGFDLANNSTHDNTVKVGTRSGSYANGFVYLSVCTATQAAPYLNGSKNLTFQNNHYTVPSLAWTYWFWGLHTVKYWNEWQAIPQDSTGTASQ